MISRQQGFTLIELMMVVAIVGTLAAIAIPAYQDYTIRAQVSEGLALASAAKVAVEDYYAQYGEWPSKNTDAALPDQHDIMGKYTEHVSVKDNLIEIKFEYEANAAIHGQKIQLAATDNSGSITWQCAGDGGIKWSHLPEACRNDPVAKKKKKKK
jgi:type IV pilus assembly protein PilA